MSTSPEAQLDLATHILNHHALDAVRDRIQLNLFQRFRRGTEEERKIIADIMDAEGLFFKELQVIVDEHAMLADEDKEKGDKEND